MVHIGLQLSSLTPYLDTLEHLQESFKKVADMGYKYVQLQGAALDIPDEEIRKALEDNGLVCVATQEDYILGFGDDPERYIKRAVTVGAKCLAFALMPFEIETVEELWDFAEKINHIKDMANEAGLDFGFHPIGYDFRLMEGVPVYERLMDMLPEDTQLIFCVHGTFASPVSYRDVLLKFGHKIKYVHFKDGVPGDDGKIQLMPLGEGDHEWKDIYRDCAATGVKYIFTEQERWNRDAFDCMETSLKYMKKIAE